MADSKQSATKRLLMYGVAGYPIGRTSAASILDAVTQSSQALASTKAAVGPLMNVVKKGPSDGR